MMTAVYLELKQVPVNLKGLLKGSHKALISW